MKPSSSSSEPSDFGLFDGVLARGPVREQVSDAAWLRAMLEVEAALARALASAGVIGEAAAAEIAAACRPESFDIAEIGRRASEAGNPVVPLVRELTARVGGEAAANVHRGATSQDVMDTAAMLVARRSLDALTGDLAGASEAAARLTATHRATVMAGRTLLQQAAPTTFGLVAAGWMTGLDEAVAGLRAAGDGLAAQLGGAVGTLASLGADGPAVRAAFAGQIGLPLPAIPWHTERTRIGVLAGALGVVAGAAGKPAADVVLLSQTEVAEVREGTPGRGGSSTLPNKHNPVAAVSALAAAGRAPGLVSTLLGSMVQEHQRAAGAWQREWRTLSDLFETTGSAAAWIRDALEHLEVDVPRMRANADLSGGLLLAERVSAILTDAIGRQAAHDLVGRLAADAADSGRSFADTLRASEDVTVHVPPDAIDDLLDPAAYLGSAGTFVEDALQAHAERPS